MRWAIIQFPGSNCDQDCLHVLREVLGQDAYYVWHKDHSLNNADAVLLPGGFSYGDYLRCGAIAKFSPIMDEVRRAAESGRIVMGICNGFQMLTEMGLLPGAFLRNQGLRFVCEHRSIRVEHPLSRFTNGLPTGELLNIPVAHGDGNYFADPIQLRDLSAHGQILFTYADSQGRVNDETNPNGSTANIAGISNKAGNIMGMMPHPERASEAILGSADGRRIFEAVIQSV